MSHVRAARIGMLIGGACALPVSVWLGAQVLWEPPSVMAPVLAVDAVRALWVAQGIAIAGVAPGSVGSSKIEKASCLLMLLMTPLPLLGLVWLMGAADLPSLGAGLVLGIAWAAMVVAVAEILKIAFANAQLRRVALGGAEVSLGLAVWAFRGEWFNWVGL